MDYKRLGRTDLKVSEICLGTMTWGSQNTEDEAHAQIDYALEQGLNFMDTAEMYPVPPDPKYQGKTEEYIGTWFKKTGQRDKWILASKVGGRGNFIRKVKSELHGAGIRSALEDSLKRLQTDHIDLYQLHWPNRSHYNFENTWTFDPYSAQRDEVTENMLEVLETLDALVREGKIRHVGLSNETTWGTMQYLRLAEEHGLPRMASIQNEYNLLRRHYDWDLAEMTAHEDVGLLAYSPLAAGVLSGKYLDGALPPGSRAAYAGHVWRNNRYSAQPTRCYVNLARDHGLDPCQMALAFCLSRPFMASVIIGATSVAQLKTDIGASDVTLSEDVLRGIESIHRLYPKPL